MTEEESIRKLLYILSMSGCGMKWIVEWTLVRLPVDKVWCGPRVDHIPTVTSQEIRERQWFVLVSWFINQIRKNQVCATRVTWIWARLLGGYGLVMKDVTERDSVRLRLVFRAKILIVLATSTPLRKRRISSPTYDAQSDELDGYDFQALDETETSFSHSVVASSIKSQSDNGKANRRRAIEDALKFARLEHHEDSGIVLVNSKARGEGVIPMSPPLRSQPSVSHASGFKSTASLCHELDHIVPHSSSASFLPVSLLVYDYSYS